MTLPQPPLLPPPHRPLPTTCRCRHHHSPPLVDLQCTSICAAISGYTATVVEPPPLALPQVIATHSLLLPLYFLCHPLFCYHCQRCCHMFTSSLFCVPVCSAYQYAIVGLFMLFPPAYQYAVVGNSMNVTFSICVLVRISTAYQYAVLTGTPT